MDKKKVVNVVIWILVLLAGIYSPQIIWRISHGVEPTYCLTPPYVYSYENETYVCRNLFGNTEVRWS